MRYNNKRSHLDMPATIGLSTEQVEELRKQYGYNELPQKRTPLIIKILKWFTTPIALILLAAAAVSFAIGHTFDGSFILFLTSLNLFVSMWHERKADKAIEALNKRLLVSVKVLRNEKWTTLNARELVPGDVVELVVGDLIPADCSVIEARNVSVNEAVITGESLPKEKKEKSSLYSGSAVFSGWMRARVDAIGGQTYVGRLIAKAAPAKRARTALEKDILVISRFLMVVSVIAIVILSVLLIARHGRIIEVVLLDLSILIASKKRMF